MSYLKLSLPHTARHHGSRDDALAAYRCAPRRVLVRSQDRTRACTGALPRWIAGASALLAACGVSAANWEVEPRAELGYRYDDNYRLDLPGEEVDVSGAEAKVLAQFRTVDPRTNFQITPQIRSTYFPDERQEDSTDYFLSALLSDETPRRRMGIGADFSRQDVVRTETPGTDLGGAAGDPGGGLGGELGSELGNPTTVDGGRIFQRNRRDLIRIAPYWSHDLSQRHRMELNAYYLQADFDDQFVGAQQDFKDFGAAVGLGFLLSERTSLTVRARASQYQTSFDTDAYGGEIEWGRVVSENSRMYVRVGAQQTKPERGESDTNVVAGLGGRWAGQRNTMFLDLTRTVGPISAGTIVERYQLRLRIDHDISQRVSLLLGARVSRDEGIEGVASYPRREYATADLGLQWRVLRSVALTARYNYRWQEYADEPSDASANGFLIGVIYEPKRRD